MLYKLTIALLSVITIGNMSTFAGDRAPQMVGHVELMDPALDKLVAPNAKMEVIGDGYIWSEGPVWIRDDNFLLWSDIPNNAIMRWDAKGVAGSS